MPKTKDTNPKDALGVKKVPFHSVPCGPLMELGLAMMEGGRKYGSHNYREIGVRASVYYDAVMRHLMSWWEGEDIDPDSGLSHIIKAIASLIVLRDSMLMNNIEDDRPLQYPNKLNINELNKKAKEIIKLYPDCKTPFVQTVSLNKNNIEDTVKVCCETCAHCPKEWECCTFYAECHNYSRWSAKNETVS